jgi:hypothetical protein
MKLTPIGKYESLKTWAFGVYVSGHWTLVVMLGTNWSFGLKRSATSFGLCVGPLTVGGAR